jgi:hypothetical protein
MDPDTDLRAPGGAITVALSGRERIDAALLAGELWAPDGTLTRWRWRAGGRDDVAVTELDHAQRLERS